MSVSENIKALWGKALIVGVVNALLLSLIMVPVVQSGHSPLPGQPSLLFAETLVGRPLPLPVGLLFHVAYVTFWSFAFVVVSYPGLSLKRALLWAAGLWLIALAVFFPIIGWGFMGLALSPKLIPASLVPHLLFGVFLWGLSRLIVNRPEESRAER